jgi:hypothetical protein
VNLTERIEMEKARLEELQSGRDFKGKRTEAALSDWRMKVGAKKVEVEALIREQIRLGKEDREALAKVPVVEPPLSETTPQRAPEAPQPVMTQSPAPGEIVPPATSGATVEAKTGEAQPEENAVDRVDRIRKSKITESKAQGNKHLSDVPYGVESMRFLTVRDVVSGDTGMVATVDSRDFAQIVWESGPYAGKTTVEHKKDFSGLAITGRVDPKEGVKRTVQAMNDEALAQAAAQGGANIVRAAKAEQKRRAAQPAKAKPAFEMPVPPEATLDATEYDIAARREWADDVVGSGSEANAAARLFSENPNFTRAGEAAERLSQWGEVEWRKAVTAHIRKLYAEEAKLRQSAPAGTATGTTESSDIQVYRANIRAYIRGQGGQPATPQSIKGEEAGRIINEEQDAVEEQDGILKRVLLGPPPKMRLAQVAKRAEKELDDAIEAKNANVLKKWLHPDTKNLRARFTEKTGVELPSTESETKKAIDAWIASKAPAAEKPTTVKAIEKVLRNDEPTTQKRAQSGGEIGPNGEWYPGGAFIATTELPKRIKQKYSKIASLGEVYEPNKRAVPEPGKLPIYGRMAGTYWNPRTGEVNEQFMEYQKLTDEQKQQVRDAAKRYADGERWISVNDAPAIANLSDVARMILAKQPVAGELVDKWDPEIRDQIKKFSVSQKATAASDKVEPQTKEGEKVNTIAGKMSYAEFERSGYTPDEVTRDEWIALQRSERRRLGQAEGGDFPNAPNAEYEEYHKQAVKEALARGEEVDDRVLADYPDLTQETTSEPAEETSPESAASAEVQPGQAGELTPEKQPIGELDPSKYEDALQITQLYAGLPENERGGGYGRGEIRGANKELLFSLDQVEQAYRTVQVSVPSPMPDTTLWAMPGQEKEVQAIGQKMTKLKAMPSDIKAPTLPKPPTLPKAVKSDSDMVKAVFEVSEDPKKLKTDQDKERRYAVTGVHVDGDRLIATDGRRMFVANGKWGKDGVYVDRISLKNGQLGKPNPELTFPKWKEIIPEYDRTDAIRVKDLPTVWRRVRQAMTMTSEETKGMVVVVNTDGELGFATATPDQGHAEINIRPGAKILGGVNPEFFLDILAFHAKRGNAEFDLYFPQADRPLLSKSDDGKTTTVLMPINLGDSESDIKRHLSITELMGTAKEKPEQTEPATSGDAQTDTPQGTASVIQEEGSSGSQGGSRSGSPGSVGQSNEMDTGRLKVSMAPQGKPTSARDILDYVRRVFAVPIKGKATHKMTAYAGWYDDKAVGIRLKDSRSISTAIHELGHYIDWSLNDRWSKKPPSKTISDELMVLGKALYGNKTPSGGYKSEGWAEFMREYITGEEAQSKAPNLYDFFVNDYLANNSEVAKKIAKAKQMVTDFRFQGAEARVESQINREAIKSPIGDKARSVLQWANTVFRDELAVLKRVAKATGKDLAPSQDPYELAVAFADKAGSRARHFVLNETTDMAGNHKGKSLREALSGISRSDFKDFTRWIYAKEALFRWSQGKNPGISKNDAKYVFDKYKSPEWESAADAVTQWNRDVLDYLVDAGGFDPTIRDLLRNTPIYIPLFRAFSKEETHPSGTGTGRGVAQYGKPVKKMKGSGREIIDPFESMIQQAEKFFSVSHKAMVAKALSRMANVPGMAEWIWKVPAPQQAVKFTSDKIKNDIRQIAIERLGLDPDEIPSDFNEPWDDMITIWQNASQYYGKDNIVSLFVDGKKQWFEVHPDLYKAIQGLDKYTLPWYLAIFGKATRAVRTGATGLNPAFGLVRNFIRDVMTFTVTAEHAKLGPVSAAKGAVMDIVGSEPSRRFKALGGEMAGQVLNDRVATQRLRGELTGGWTITTAKHPIQAIRELFGISELGPRIAEFEKALETSEKKYGKGTLDASLVALNAAQDVTTNFTRHGTLGKVLNELIPFFNAAIQGPDKIVRTFAKRPGRTTAVALASLTVPAIILWWIAHDEEWYDKLSDEEKANYLHFRIPFTERIVRIPIPFELGYIFQTIPMAVMDRLWREDKGQIQDIVKIAVERSNPLDWPAAVGPAIDVIANRSWSGNPIVTEAMKQKLPEDRSRPYTTSPMKSLGSLLGVAPVQLEYLANSYSGGLYYRIARTADLVVGAGGQKTISDVPVIGTLFTRESDRPSESLDRFYKRLELLNQKAGSDKISVDERLERTELTKAAKTLSELRKNLEVEGLSGEQKTQFYQQMDKELASVLDLQNRKASPVDILSVIAAKSYSLLGDNKAPSLNTKTGKPNQPGTPEYGQEVLVEQLKAEYEKRTGKSVTIAQIAQEQARQQAEAHKKKSEAIQRARRTP